MNHYPESIAKMTFFFSFFKKYFHILFYGLLMAFLLLVLKWLQWRFLIKDSSVDIYAGFIALIFTFLGIWLASNLAKPKIKTVIVEKEVFVPAGKSAISENLLERLKLTQREYEVLQCLTCGYSNAEIADALFLSVSTIKTHVSNLFVKMEVKSRTQAIEKAKRLRIIP